jgi:uncharacterized protein (TIGR03085 family)
MTSQTAIPAQRERHALCDLFLEVGPDAPTLSGEWTTRDLAAHLVIRERRPDAAAGIVFSKLAGYTDKVQTATAATDYTELVAKVRSGPPMFSPMKITAVDRATNTIEYFVHYEDVRRAQPDWDVRAIDADLRNDLRGAISRMGKMLTRSLKVGLTLEPTDTTDAAPIVTKAGSPMVTARGPIGEIVLFLYGRKDHATVELLGDDDAVQIVRDAAFGV